MSQSVMVHGGPFEALVVDYDDDLDREIWIIEDDRAYRYERTGRCYEYAYEWGFANRLFPT